MKLLGLMFASAFLGAIAFAEPAAAQAPPGAAGIPVTVATAKRQDVPVLLRNIGSVQALQTVLVRARVDGTLTRVFFTEGQDVKAGDKLAEIDPRPYAAALAQAQARKAADAAQLGTAQRDLARTTSLAQNSFASRQQQDQQAGTVAQLQANIQGDEAAIAAAQLNLDFCTITAPFDGRVGLRQVDPGNLIRAADTQGIVTVTQIHPIAVVFPLPQENLPAVQAALRRGAVPVTASTTDGGESLDQGRLLTIDSAVDQSTGTIRLKAEFPNPENRLWPGAFVTASLRADTLKGIVTVPSAAIQRGPNGMYVYVVKPDNTVVLTLVDVAQDDAGTAAITKGLDDGAQVVVAGHSRLQSGTHVRIKPPGEAAKGGANAS